MVLDSSPLVLRFIFIETVMQSLPPFDVAVVFGIVFLAFALFVTEFVPMDVTAITVLVLLVLLEPWTQISVTDGFAGFSNHATLTVLALFIVSDAVRQTGVLRTIGSKIVAFAGSDERKQVGLIMGLSGSTAGIVNNTPVVAVLIPMVTDIAERTGTSPSKLLIPLSYAAMMGGMLTLIGTAPNLIASEVSARLLDRPYTMFEFTTLGAIQLVAGSSFVIFIGRHLIPERIQPGQSIVDRFELTDYLTEVVVEENSPLVGRKVSESFRELEMDVNILQIRRVDRRILEPTPGYRIQAGDELLLQTDRDTLFESVDALGIRFPDEEPSVEGKARSVIENKEETDLVLAELIVVPRTWVEGHTLEELRFRQRFDASVLGIRRGGYLAERPLKAVRLRGGDTLLVQATESALERLGNNRNFVVTREIERPTYRREKSVLVMGIVLAVVGVAALGIYPIVLTAMGGVVVLVFTGCLTPREMYEAVDWGVIFLLAGLIPLGVSMERTGAALYLAELIIPLADVVPILAFLWVFYMLTALTTEVMSNVASIIVMAPVAVEVALQIGSNPFAFILLTTFAASDSLMTPVGYQTNLMVFEKGGYKFTDFMRIGVPLQVILGVVTTLGIAVFWGV
jgi:di/tricarboxylate transporter